MIKAAARVLLVGYGQMGHAMHALLARRAHLAIWRVTPQRQTPSAAIRKAVMSSNFVILCVPTVALDSLLAHLTRSAAHYAVYLSFAKGLDDTGRTAADILEAQFSTRVRWGVLGGPMIAAELSAGRHGYVEFGTRRTAAWRAVPWYTAASSRCRRRAASGFLVRRAQEHLHAAVRFGGWPRLGRQRAWPAGERCPRRNQPLGGALRRCTPHSRERCRPR